MKAGDDALRRRQKLAFLRQQLIGYVRSAEHRGWATQREKQRMAEIRSEMQGLRKGRDGTAGGDEG